MWGLFLRSLGEFNLGSRIVNWERNIFQVHIFYVADLRLSQQ